MFLRTQAVWVLVLLGCVSQTLGQRVDPEVRDAAQKIVTSLREQAESVLPAGTEISLWAMDGRVFSWTIELKKDIDLAALTNEVGVPASDLRGALDKWSERLSPRILKMTVDAVKATGNDPDFNPETDVTIAVCGHVLPRLQPTLQRPDDDGSFYWISFTGTRRDELRDAQGKILREAAGPPTGGEITVAIAPDLPVWKRRETITGRLTIKNTGTRRVRISAWGIDSVEVTDETGKEPERFSIMGHIHPSSDAAMYRFLKPGEEHVGTFSVYTDRLHTMRNGYYLGAGRWRLTYPQGAAENVRLIGDPAFVEVGMAPNEYVGPRIMSVLGTGKNLILLREGGWVEVIDPVAGDRLGTKRPASYVPGWMWYGSQLKFSSDGRLIAYCNNRQSPIIIESMFGDPPLRNKFAPPEDLTVGQGGFSAGRFMPGDSKLLCVTNDTWVVMDLATGKALKTSALPDMWPRSSPDGRYAAWFQGALIRIVGYRNTDECTVTVLDTDGELPQHSVIIKGHGEYPELHMGATGVYLSDEFASSVVMVPYVNAAAREFQTGAPADVIGESSDGSVVALAWPRAETDGEHLRATTVAVYRVSDGAKLCTIAGTEPRGVALLSGPPRIVCMPRNTVDDGFCPASWLAERATVYDALTGKPINEIDLTPKPGTMPDQPK